MRSIFLAASVLMPLMAACGGDKSLPVEPSTPPDTIQLHIGGVVGTPTFARGDTPTGGQGDIVSGVACDNRPEAYHIHVHLSLFVAGKQLAIPLAIGVVGPQIASLADTTVVYAASNCFYWLHTHDATGILHVEPPVQQQFTLGQFFDVWGQPLSSTNVAGYTGTVTVSVDGAPYTGDPRAIEFTAHKQITLQVGTPVVTPPVYVFPEGY